MNLFKEIIFSMPFCATQCRSTAFNGTRWHCVPSSATAREDEGLPVRLYDATPCHLVPSSASGKGNSTKLSRIKARLTCSATYCHPLPPTVTYCHKRASTAIYCHLLPFTAIHCHKTLMAHNFPSAANSKPQHHNPLLYCTTKPGSTTHRKSTASQASPSTIKQ